MSERGSFVTSYVYCADCLAVLEDVLCKREKYLCGQRLDSWLGDKAKLPIIAGKVGGLYSNEEVHTFEFELIPELCSRLCHEVHIAVLPENGEPTLYKLSPDP